MFLKKLVENTVKAVGTASKVGVEIGADLIGAIAEKASDDPGLKEKYSNQGKEIGQRIKNTSNKIAISGGNAAEELVKKSRDTYESVKNSVGEYLNEMAIERKAKVEKESGSNSFNKEEPISCNPQPFHSHNSTPPQDHTKTFDERYMDDVRKISEYELKRAVDSVYDKFSSKHGKQPGFGESGVIEFAAAIILAVHDRNLSRPINEGMDKFFSGEFGPLDFSNYMDEVINRSRISYSVWSESYRYIKENHKWLTSHRAATSKRAPSNAYGFRKLVNTAEKVFTKPEDTNVAAHSVKNVNKINPVSNPVEDYAYIEGLIGKARELKRKGDLEGAKNELLGIISLNTKYGAGYYELGKVAYLLKDMELSKRCYLCSMHAQIINCQEIVNEKEDSSSNIMLRANLNEIFDNLDEQIKKIIRIKGAAIIFMDNNMPRHFAHTLIDFKSGKYTINDDISSHIYVYSQHISNSSNFREALLLKGISEEKYNRLEEEYYLIEGRRLFLKEIDWKNIYWDDVYEIYFNSRQ